MIHSNLNNSSSGRAIVLYEGPNYLWPVKNSIIFAIVEHEKERCIEMIAYQTEPKHEAPRVYFHADVLYSKIDQHDIDARVNATIEELTATNQRMSRAALPLKALQRLAAEFLLTRVTVNTSKSVDRFLEAKFSIMLSALDGDKVVGRHIDGQLVGVDPVVDLHIKPYLVNYNSEKEKEAAAAAEAEKNQNKSRRGSGAGSFLSSFWGSSHSKHNNNSSSNNLTTNNEFSSDAVKVPAGAKSSATSSPHHNGSSNTNQNHQHHHSGGGVSVQQQHITAAAAAATAASPSFNNIVENEPSSPAPNRSSWGSFSLLGNKTDKGGYESGGSNKGSDDERGTSTPGGHRHRKGGGSNACSPTTTPHMFSQPVEQSSSPVSSSQGAPHPPAPGSCGPRKRSFGSFPASPLFMSGGTGPSTSTQLTPPLTNDSTQEPLSAAPSNGLGIASSLEPKKLRARTLDSPALSSAIDAANLEKVTQSGRAYLQELISEEPSSNSNSKNALGRSGSGSIYFPPAIVSGSQSPSIQKSAYTSVPTGGLISSVIAASRSSVESSGDSARAQAHAVAQAQHMAEVAAHRLAVHGKYEQMATGLTPPDVPPSAPLRPIGSTDKLHDHHLHRPKPQYSSLMSGSPFLSPSMSPIGSRCGSPIIMAPISPGGGSRRGKHDSTRRDNNSSPLVANEPHEDHTHTQYTSSPGRHTRKYNNSTLMAAGNTGSGTSTGTDTDNGTDTCPHCGNVNPSRLLGYHTTNDNLSSSPMRRSTTPTSIPGHCPHCYPFAVLKPLESSASRAGSRPITPSLPNAFTVLGSIPSANNVIVSSPSTSPSPDHWVGGGGGGGFDVEQKPTATTRRGSKSGSGASTPTNITDDPASARNIDECLAIGQHVAMKRRSIHGIDSVSGVSGDSGTCTPPDPENVSPLFGLPNEAGMTVRRHSFGATHAVDMEANLEQLIENVLPKTLPPQIPQTLPQTLPQTIPNPHPAGWLPDPAEGSDSDSAAAAAAVVQQPQTKTEEDGRILPHHRVVVGGGVHPVTTSLAPGPLLIPVDPIPMSIEGMVMTPGGAGGDVTGCNDDDSDRQQRVGGDTHMMTTTSSIGASALTSTGTGTGAAVSAKTSSSTPHHHNNDSDEFIVVQAPLHKTLSSRRNSLNICATTAGAAAGAAAGTGDVSTHSDTPRDTTVYYIPGVQHDSRRSSDVAGGGSCIGDDDFIFSEDVPGIGVGGGDGSTSRGIGSVGIFGNTKSLSLARLLEVDEGRMLPEDMDSPNSPEDDGNKKKVSVVLHAGSRRSSGSTQGLRLDSDNEAEGGGEVFPMISLDTITTTTPPSVMQQEQQSPQRHFRKILVEDMFEPEPHLDREPRRPAGEHPSHRPHHHTTHAPLPKKLLGSAGSPFIVDGNGDLWTAPSADESVYIQRQTMHQHSSSTTAAAAAAAAAAASTRHHQRQSFGYSDGVLQQRNAYDGGGGQAPFLGVDDGTQVEDIQDIVAYPYDNNLATDAAATTPTPTQADCFETLITLPRKSDSSTAAEEDSSRMTAVSAGVSLPSVHIQRQSSYRTHGSVPALSTSTFLSSTAGVGGAVSPRADEQDGWSLSARLRESTARFVTMTAEAILSPISNWVTGNRKTGSQSSSRKDSEGDLYNQDSSNTDIVVAASASAPAAAAAASHATNDDETKHRGDTSPVSQGDKASFINPRLQDVKSLEGCPHPVITSSGRRDSKDGGVDNDAGGADDEHKSMAYAFRGSWVDKGEKRNHFSLNRDNSSTSISGRSCGSSNSVLLRGSGSGGLGGLKSNTSSPAPHHRRPLAGAAGATGGDHRDGRPSLDVEIGDENDNFSDAGSFSSGRQQPSSVRSESGSRIHQHYHRDRRHQEESSAPSSSSPTSSSPSLASPLSPYATAATTQLDSSSPLLKTAAGSASKPSMPNGYNDQVFGQASPDRRPSQQASRRSSSEGIDSSSPCTSYGAEGKATGGEQGASRRTSFTQRLRVEAASAAAAAAAAASIASFSDEFELLEDIDTSKP